MREIFNFTLLFISGMVIVLCVISTDYVFGESKGNYYSWSNTVIEEKFEPDSFDFEVDNSSGSVSRVNSLSEYNNDLSSIGKTIRKAMVGRKNTVSVKYKMDSSELSKSKWFSTLCNNMIKKAFIHTGVPEEGDSLKFCVKGYTSKASYFTISGYSYITVTFKLSYFTSSSQETKLDSKIEQLDLKGSSDYQTVKNIYSYICKNVKYNYNKDSSLKYTAYNAAVNKSAVCQGYSVLFYRLALEYGIDTRVIAGKGRDGAHVWNIVKLGNKYYYLDTTWDAGESKYDYFLKGYNDFKNHTRNSEYSTDSFKNKYPVSSSNYSCKSHKWNDFYTVDKKATYAAAGSKSIHCSVCGSKRTSTIKSIPKLVCKLAAPEKLRTSLTDYYGSTAGYDDIKIKWNKVSGAKGYCVKYRKIKTDKWYVKYTSKNYTYLKDRSDGTKYEIRVYPYVTEKNKKYLSGKYASVNSVYTLKKCVITKVSKGLNNISISWNDIYGETGYQIYRAESKDGKYSKFTTVKSNDKNTVSVPLNKENDTVYWYKVRAYKALDNDKYVYGPWSEKIKMS